MINLRTLALGLVALSPLASRSLANGATQQSSVGTNLAAVNYFSPQWIFVDAFKQCREWLPQLADASTWNTGQPLALTPDGWPLLQPGQAAGTIMFKDMNGVYPGGLYTCLYDGTGEIEFRFDASIVSQTPGRIVVDVTPDNGGIYLKVVASDVNDPVRNIRLIMPGFESTYQTQIFHPRFIERLSGFRTLRFMNWMRTNDSTISEWSDRPTPSNYSQATDKGVALEYLIELCNRTGADPWFNIPHLATDEYVENFAAMVRDQLDPSLHAYVEYSNEIWNSNLDQTDWASAMGQAMGFSNEYKEAALFFNSYRAVQIFDIWENQFGSTDRFVRVLAAQAVSTFTAQQILDFQNAYQSADAYAIAPYFGGTLGSTGNAPNTVLLSVDEILDECQSDLVNVTGVMTANLAEASSRGLELLTYEGGQHLRARGIWENDPVLTGKFIDANRHPRMEGLYEDYMDIWRLVGGDVMTLYTGIEPYNETGSWGLLEYLGQPIQEAPKYRAVRRAIAEDTCPDPVVYCPPNANSVGSGANIGWDGFASVELQDFELVVDGVPPNVPGLFFYGPEMRNYPLGGGIMCVGGGGGMGIYRLAPFAHSNGSGVVRRALDFQSRPIASGTGRVLAGTEWQFQYIYRDPATQAFNLSSALSTTFCP